MQESLLKRIQKYILEHVHVKRWRRIVGSLACLVVFCTTYALILPALTMTSTTYCGLEEHTHSDECYSEVLVCGQEEMAAHEHTDACYTTQQVLTCGMEESAGHTHTDVCYDEAGNLICGMEESEGHTHTDACYTEEKTLTCTESTTGHIHSVDCYEKQLTCGKEEHTHSLACYSDSTADVETAEVWERTLPTDLTGVWADDVLSVAKSQLGYTESEKNYEVDDEGNTKGYTRYGDWYGVPYGDWCAMFASFCLNYANVPDTAIPYEASCANWVEKLTQTEQYQSVDSGYTPNPGDLIFFDNKNAGTANHVGIVTEVVTENDATYVKTIEGNSANKVCENRYLIDNEHILGYGVLPEHCECYDNDGNQICEDGCTCDCHNHTWSEDMQPAAETEAEATADAYSLSYQGEDYEVVLSWSEEGVLPEGTELTAVEISADSEEYQQYYQQTVSALVEQGQLAEGEELPFARYFDVQLTYNGESIEPTGTVNVTVNYADSVLDDGTQVGAVHFTDDGTDILSATATAGESGTAISHQQDSFSTVGDYGIMTADNSNSSSSFVSNSSTTSTSQFEHSKTIDYLGDGVTNPDTDLSGQDYYRLYLDMTGKSEPVDLLIVVDASGSMDKTDMTGGMRRDAAITKFLNGATNASNSSGFISEFLSMNSENKIAVVNFYGNTSYNGWEQSKYSRSTLDYTTDSSILQDWTSSTSFVDCTNKTSNGTNYEAGLKRATELLSSSTVKSDGHKKVVVFLSDGVPTYFMIDSNDVGTYSATYNNITYKTTIKNKFIGYRWGNGIYNSADNYILCKEPSKKAFDDFMTANPDVTVYTVGVSSDISATSNDESQSPEVLQYMAEKGGGKFYSVKDDMDTLKGELESLVYPQNVSITDELSQYVRYYGTQPDVKVTMTDKTTGTVTTLYENGAVTSGGSGILASVTYTDTDTSETPTGSTGTVTAKFVESYQLDQNCTYTLSFNVKTTQTAYNEYASSGYNATGDANTDYGENTTSSNQSGFHSNTHAWVTYTTGGTEHTEDYDHPVVQVITVPDVPSNPDSDGTPTFAHTKTIDSLNDGVTNPDTTLSGTDFYRLYLDMTGKTEPVDLLLVVDGSWSMGVNSDIDNERRDVALGEFLNGTSSDEGFISYFLGLNAENKISVVQFAGDGEYNGDYWNGNYGSLGGNNISKNGWSIDNDSSVLLDWNSAGTIGSSQPDCTAKYNAGTNYEAGLKKATSQLSKVADDGNRKVMVFLSDGAPTYFVIDQNDVGKKSTYSATSNMHDTDLSASNVGKRYGHGFGTEYADIKEATKQAFDDFVESNPGVLVYTVGVSKSVTEVTYGNNGEVQSSPEVLQYMAEKGGGNYYAITDSMSTLKEELQSLFYPSNVTITDKLSQYVRYYGDQPDVKVTMKNNSTGVETVLYENGQSTNTTIFSTVKYYDGDTSDTPTESTGIVQAVFNPSYKLSPDYTYTLSFNVKSTQTTYNEYRYNGMDYNGVTGDANTDYGTNTTSSNQPGFHSNTIAWVDYTVDKKKYSSLYDHPVVQVNLTGPELPATGGSGTLWYTAGGAVLVGGSLLYGFDRRRKRERRVQ